MKLHGTNLMVEDGHKGSSKRQTNISKCLHEKNITENSHSLMVYLKARDKQEDIKQKQ